MSGNISDILVIGVSSRALFDLDEENAIFLQNGIAKYRQYQLENENVLLKKGTAFNLVESLLSLNDRAKKRIVEVVVMSKNSPETGVRMLNSISAYNLDITKIALSGGESLSPYVSAYGVDLFLSKDENDIQAIIDANNCAAAIICPPPANFKSCDKNVKIAFDADSVIFSDNSEFRFETEGLKAFEKYEKDNAEIALEEGPFANLLKKLSKIQINLDSNIESSPLRIAIVTARAAPTHMRVIKTLRKWGVYVDEAYFLGGLSKDKILESFGAQIFFDDQDSHLTKSSKVVPSAKVPYKSDSPMKKLKTKNEKK